MVPVLERFLDSVSRDLVAQTRLLVDEDLRNLTQRVAQISKTVRRLVDVEFAVRLMVAAQNARYPVKPGTSVHLLPVPSYDLPFTVSVESAQPVSPITLARPSTIFESRSSVEIVLASPLPGLTFLPVSVAFWRDSESKHKVTVHLSFVPAA